MVKAFAVSALAALLLTVFPKAPTVPPVGLPAETALIGAAAAVLPGRNYADVPESILDKVERYPESLEFAARYYAFGHEEREIDISGDVASEPFPLLLQWDRRWGYLKYGTDYMGNNGCGPTALATVYVGLTGNSDHNPYDIAQFSVKRGLYVPHQGTKWALMTVGGEYLGLRVKPLWTSEGEIRKGLEAGQMMIARVGKGDFTTGGHFIVICGITEDDQLIIRDPNSRINSGKLWDFDRVMQQTTCWWSYSVK